MDEAQFRMPGSQRRIERLVDAREGGLDVQAMQIHLARAHCWGLVRPFERRWPCPPLRRRQGLDLALSDDQRSLLNLHEQLAVVAHFTDDTLAVRRLHVVAHREPARHRGTIPRPGARYGINRASAVSAAIRPLLPRSSAGLAGRLASATAIDAHLADRLNEFELVVDIALQPG